MTTNGALIERRVWTSPVVLRRIRRLAVDGRVTVREHNLVRPEDVVARGEQPLPAVVVPIAKQLGLGGSPVELSLVRRPGDPVEAGEVLAKKKGTLGLGGRTCLSPVAGTLFSGPVDSGEYLVVPAPTPIELGAHFPGSVVAVYPQRGVVIEFTAVGAQGAFGCGGEGGGPLRVLGGPREAISAGRIVPRLTGSVLVGGTIDIAALRRAAALGVAGVVVGTIRSAAYEAFLEEPQRLPLVVVEGFGQSGMSILAHEVLRLQEGREARVSAGDANTFGPDDADPPEVLIPIDGREAKRARPIRLALGCRVRVVGGRDAFATGSVVAVGAAPAQLASGLFAQWIEVELEEGRRVRVPTANVELVDGPTGTA